MTSPLAALAAATLLVFTSPGANPSPPTSVSPLAAEPPRPTGPSAPTTPAAQNAPTAPTAPTAPPAPTAPTAPPAPTAPAASLIVDVRDGSGRVSLSLSPRSLSSTAVPSPEPGFIAPNGTLVADLVREEEGRISVITVAPRNPADGARGEARRVVVTVDRVDDLHWTPDSASLFYVRTRGDNPQVRRVILATQSDEEITDAVAPCAMPRIAPDGTTAFVILRDARPETLVHDMYVGSVGALEHAVSMTTITALEWAADGTHLLYATPTAIVECARRGKLVREWKFAELDPRLAGHRVTALAPSPDGTFLAAIAEAPGSAPTGEPREPLEPRERRLFLLTLDPPAISTPTLPGEPVSVRWR